MPDSQNFTFETEMADPAAPKHNPNGLSESQNDVLRYTPPKHLKRIGIGAGALALVVVGIGLAGRMVAASKVQDWTADQAIPVVKLIAPAGPSAGHDLVLPGSLQAYNNAPIFAQVAGTILKWHVDIGAKVKSGDVLAEIDPRSYRAALDQARGQLARDTASLANAKDNLQRYQSLAKQNAISSQQLQNQESTVESNAGVVAADRAAVEAASINLGYTRIVAPFDGVVTSRSVDIGNFVAAGNASGTPLFTVSDQNRLRLYVRVPQGYSAQVVPGTKASFTVPEYPGRSFTATVGASASAVDSSSGSVLVQLLADNSEKLLKPGSYAQVRFAFTAPAVSAEIPSSALIFRNGGMAVAAVGPKNKVVFRPVEILRDNGATVQLASSFERGERIIDNPPDSLGQGDEVRVASKAAGRN